MASTKGSHSFADQVAALDWRRIAQDLDDSGNALIPGLLGASDCRDVAGWYAEDARANAPDLTASNAVHYEIRYLCKAQAPANNRVVQKST